MDFASLKPIGILLLSSSTLGTYSVVGVYRKPPWRLRDVVHLLIGLDKTMHMDYSRIESALGDALAPFIQKIWRRKYTKHSQTYFQMHKYASPSLVEIAGLWRIWAIL